MLQEKYATEINTILNRYAHRRSTVLPLLYLAQDEYGHLTPEALNEVAEIAEVSSTDVFEVAGFYTLFYKQPVGKWVLQVCDDVPCCYSGAEELIEALKDELEINENETTPDGMFTLQRVKCLAACNRAPVVQANLDYIYDLTPDKIDDLLRNLRSQLRREEKLSISGRKAEDYEMNAEGDLRKIQYDLGGLPEKQQLEESKTTNE